MNKKGKIIIILVITFIAALISYALSYFFVSFLKNNFSFVFKKELLLDKTVLIVAAAIFLACLIAIIFVCVKYVFTGYTKMLAKTTKLDSTLYGSSDWQTQKEIDKNYKKITWRELPITLDAQGLVIAAQKNKDGSITVNRVTETHSLVLATTRVGKTTFFISPNIQYLGNCINRPSMFITDPKGELYGHNSQFLKDRGYNIFVFNLDEPTKSFKYNPLGIVWDFYHKYKETGDTSYLDDAESLLREVAATIAPVAGNDPTWDIGAQNIIQGICLAMLEDSDDPTFGMTKEKFTIWQILNILTQGTDNLRDFGLRRSKTSLARKRLAQYVDNNAKETLGSFMVTTTNKLNQYVDTGMTYLMSDTELNLDEISSKPYAIFCITPDDNTARHPLAVLFASQIYKSLIHLSKLEQRKNPAAGQKLPNEFYFILEEFGNFPKMECIEQMLSIGGGRRIWTCIVLQSLSQLRKVYGKETAETIMNNLKLQVYMGTTENETNKYYSEFFGSKTVKKNSVQLSSADLMKDVAGSTSAEKAQLILPDELAKLKLGEIVFKVFRDNPCRTMLQPIFDKDLQANQTFKIGAYHIDYKSTPPNSDELYYDLQQRDDIYDNIHSANLPTAPTIEEPQWEGTVYENYEEFTNSTEQPSEPTELSAQQESNNSENVMDYLKKIKGKGKKK